MKLELKHIAPYLPYGLPIRISNHKCDYVGIELSKVNGYYYIGDSLHVTYEGGSTGKDQSVFKPILRPMSDLSTRYGDGVINEHSINMLLGKDGNYGEVTVSQWKDSFDIEIELGNDAPYQKSIDFKLMILVMDELYRGHFDVFGLIDQGLAIDINHL